MVTDLKLSNANRARRVIYIQLTTVRLSNDKVCIRLGAIWVARLTTTMRIYTAGLSGYIEIAGLKSYFSRLGLQQQKVVEDMNGATDKQTLW